MVADRKLKCFSIAILGAVLSSCSSFDSKAVCEEARTSESWVSVPLMMDVPNPAYYVVKNYYAVLVEPESAMHYLSDQEDENAKQLLSAVKVDVPLKENTDIFKYAVSDTTFTSTIDRLVADLLERGEASLVDLVRANDSSQQREVKVVSVENGGKLRYFCGPTGRPLFYVVDEIWD